MTVQSICASAVKISVESDVESLVSRYEKHFKIDRQLDETQAEHEMEISENGPLISHADKLLNKAMNSYWKTHGGVGGEWHFTRKGTDKSSFFQSKVLDRLKKEPSRLHFMDL